MSTQVSGKFIAVRGVDAKGKKLSSDELFARDSDSFEELVSRNESVSEYTITINHPSGVKTVFIFVTDANYLNVVSHPSW